MSATDWLRSRAGPAVVLLALAEGKQAVDVDLRENLETSLPGVPVPALTIKRTSLKHN